MTNIELLFSTGNMLRNSWPVAWQNSLVLSPNVQQCESRGTVRINSLDPLDKPSIDPAYLTAPGDFDRVLYALNLSRTLLSSSSSSGAAFEAFQFQEVLPGPSVATRDQLLEWVTNHAATGYHYIGTCKMGAASDPLAVVNPLTMAVHGLLNIRVVDASVAPTSFSANTQSLTMAVAARAVDLIIADYVTKAKAKQQLGEQEQQTATA
jgi:choline dehydrogenase